MKRHLTPGEHWSIARLAYWHLDRGRWRQAEVLARGLLTLNGQDPTGWLYYGEARLHQGDVGEAIRGFGEAARLFEGRPEVWLRLGDCLLREGRRQEARLALENARACCGEEAGLLRRVLMLLRRC